METLEGRAILVVDDDADTLELYATTLAKLGADIRRAKSAETAISLMRTWRPDVVLCDLHLPGFDGYAFLDHVQADPTHHDVPVIAISGSHPTIERERALRAGFAQHFAKPAKLREIVEALHAAIDTRRLVA
jgi:CheY-like chemotaxis protein